MKSCDVSNVSSLIIRYPFLLTSSAKHGVINLIRLNGNDISKPVTHAMLPPCLCCSSIDCPSYALPALANVCSNHPYWGLISIIACSFLFNLLVKFVNVKASEFIKLLI